MFIIKDRDRAKSFLSITSESLLKIWLNRKTSTTHLKSLSEMFSSGCFEAAGLATVWKQPEIPGWVFEAGLLWADTHQLRPLRHYKPFRVKLF